MSTETGNDTKGGTGGTGGTDDKITTAVEQALERLLPRVVDQAVRRLAKPAPAAPAPAAPADDDDDDPDAAAGAGAGAAPAAGKGDGRYKKLQAQIKRLEAQRAADINAARLRAAYDRVTAEMSGKVRPEYVTQAITMLKGLGAISLDADGEPRYRDGEDEMPLSEGIARFLKSPHGAMFAPAKQATPKPVNLGGTSQQSGVPIPVTIDDANRASVLSGALGLLH